MIKGTEKINSSWEYMKWFTGDYAQAEFSNEMVAIIGDSAKHPTANMHALKNMPWTQAELKQVEAQFNNLASVPNYPGYYILDRYTNFAFLDAYNSLLDPVDSLLNYINTINKEITRKRKEFDYEILEVGQTLAEKRTAQALELMAALTSHETEIAEATAALEAMDAEAIAKSAQAFAALSGQDLATVIAEAAEYRDVAVYVAGKQNGESDTLAVIAMYLQHIADAYESYART
jgi:hypothetical protein